MEYFSKEFVKFLNDLTKNNHREWFHANKERYEMVVKNPFHTFITDLLEEVFKIDDEIAIEAKEAIYRINRDIRFSKDKTPYKTNVSANIAKDGRKDMLNPGFYLEVNAKRIALYSGVYMPDTKALRSIRAYIMEHDDQFKKIISEKNFKKHFVEVQGEKSKIIPKEMKDFAVSQPLIYNKQFLMIEEWKTDLLLSKDLIKTIIESYKASRALSQFLSEAVTS